MTLTRKSILSRLLEAVGGCWKLLEAVGSYGRLLEAVGGFGRLSEAVEGCWRLLEAVGGYGRLLEAVGGYEALVLSQDNLNRYMFQHFKRIVLRSIFAEIWPPSWTPKTFIFA